MKIYNFKMISKIKTVLIIFCFISTTSCGSVDKIANIKGDEQSNSCKIEFSTRYDLVDGLNILTLIPNRPESQPITFMFDEVSAFSEGLAGIQLNDKWGFIDKTGNIVIKPQFDNVSSFSEGLAGIQLKGKWGLIDKTGNIVIKPQFDYVYEFSEGLAGIQLKGKWGLIDKTGNIVIKPQFDWMYNFSEGFADIRLKDKWGFIDKTGNIVVKPQFDKVGSFKEGLAEIKLKDKWGFIDKTGNIVVKPQFDKVRSFKEGLAEIELKDKWGFIDKTGNIVVKPQFDKVSSFGEGLAGIQLKDKWGFIDKTGNIVINPQFDFKEVWSFENGICFFKSHQGTYGFIDKNGVYDLDSNLTDILFHEDNNYSEEKGKELYLKLNKSSQLLIKQEFKLNRINDTFIVGIDKQKGIINYNGMFIIEPIFDDISSSRSNDYLTPVKINDKWGFLKLPSNCK